MILWTFQPIEIWNLIRETGTYRCDPAKCSMPEFADAYQWLIRQMEQRIGPRPNGVEYPVWAWYMQNGKQRKPDLRSERWGYGQGDEDYVCIELEIPDEQVLLSDFDDWHAVLNNWILTDSMEESDRLEVYLESLPPNEQKAFREHNWEQVLLPAPAEVAPSDDGKWVQATFWELRKDMVRDVRFFRTGKRKREDVTS